MSFRYSPDTRFYRSSINLQTRSRRTWTNVIRVDDAHEFRHVDIGKGEGKHLIVSAGMPAELIEENGETRLKLPKDWFEPSGVNYIYSEKWKSPLIICPPLHELAEHLLELATIAKEPKKPKILRLKLPLLLFPNSNIQTKGPTAEPEIVEKILELGDDFFKIIKKKKSKKKL